MRIVSLQVNSMQQTFLGDNQKIFTFTPGVNIVFSKENSVGKTTLLRMLIRGVKIESRSVRSRQEILESQCRAYRKELDRLGSAKMRYYEDYAAGRLTKEGFAKRKSGIANQEGEINLKLQVAENQLDQLQERLKESTSQLVESERVTAYQDVTELTPDLVKALIRQITVRPDGGIIISWNYRDELTGIVEFEQFIVEEQAV